MRADPLPLFLRSYFSFLSGCRSPGDLLDAAGKAGYSCAVLVDETGFYGAPEFFREARKRQIKPLLGVTFPEERITLLCLNTDGFARANRIISRERRSSGSVVAELLEEGWDGLLVLTLAPEALFALGERSTQGLYVSMTYGAPPGEAAGLAIVTDFGLFARTDAVRLSDDDREISRVLRGIAFRAGQHTAYHPPEGDETLPEPAQYESFFAGYPSAIGATRSYAEQSDLSSLFTSTRVFPVFGKFSPADEYRLLERRCARGITGRYGGESRQVRRRVDHELAVIRRMGYAGYFLVVDDIVRRCSRSCGRGSSAASIVCYLLGITQVDPLKHDLSFERFLSEARTDPPDIDVDFPWDERREALGYVFSHYPGRSGMVADHITFGARSGLRMAARAEGYSEEEATAFVGLGLEGRLERVPWPVRRIAERLLGIPRHLGTHTGGVVITPGPIEQITHTQASSTGVPVIAYEKAGAKEAGLVKIDLLGSRSLAVLRDAERLAGEQAGRPVRIEALRPSEDPAARRLIERGDTLGVFYIESPATRMVLKRMRMGDYAHLIAATSVIRPAAKEYLGSYLERLCGAQWKPLHPRLSETLKDTYGVMVFQEDISRVAADLCGFCPGEADTLRRVLSAGDRERYLPDWRRRFFEKGRGQGVDDGVLRRAWGMMLSFQGYSFCKAHGASYTGLAFKLAYLKAHFPLAFMTAVINNGGGYYGRQTYLNAVRRMGFSLLPPDINLSFFEYTVEEGSLRVGLSQLRGVSVRLLRRLISERSAGGPYRSLRELERRVSPSSREVEILIRSGSIDTLSGCTGRSKQAELFSPDEPDEGVLSARELADEMKALGLLITCHPVTPFRQRAVNRMAGEVNVPLIDSRELPDYHSAEVRILCYLASGKEVETRKRDCMCFVCFEDEYSLFQGVLYPGTYRELLPELRKRLIFCAAGRVIRENEEPVLVVRRLYTP